MAKAIKFLLVAMVFFSLAACKKDNYPGGTVSPYIALFDLRSVYKGSDVILSASTLFGSSKITGVVVSDHSGANLPQGLLVIQDRRRLGQLRGISINLGTDASMYVPGDSVVVNIDGGVLTRKEGILVIEKLSNAAITKISSGNTIAPNRVPASSILANPDAYESTLAVIVKGGFNPLPAPGDVLSGDKILNDGFGDLTMRTLATASFAQQLAPFLANFYGIVFRAPVPDGTFVPQLRVRKAQDIVVLSSTIETTPVVISGFMSDVAGGDGNYEYIQLMATRNIDFSQTPFSVVVTNNANASTPTGFPVNGWATGGMRTYKMNLTSGTAAKGSFFYVGGSGKLINGATSTSMATSNWIRAFNYTTTGGDGFGTATSGLLANSGNASGIAVFEGTSVTASSKPVDAVFIGSGGSLFTNTPAPAGYRVPNSDFYDVRNPITLDDQPFYRSGSNTLMFAYNTADLGFFNMLGGEYDASLGRWTKARAQNNVLLTKTSPISMIEGAGSTLVKN